MCVYFKKLVGSRIYLSPMSVDDAEKYKKIQNEAEELAKEALDTIDKDTEAFLVVSNAFGLPKETEEEKQ